MLFKNRRVQDWLRGEEIHRVLPVFRGVGWPRVNLTPGVTYSCGREPASSAPWAKCLLRNELRRRPDCNPPKPRLGLWWLDKMRLGGGSGPSKGYWGVFPPPRPTQGASSRRHLT